MNLDEFRKLFQNQGFAEREIKIGTVIRYMAMDVVPEPKQKMRLIVGFSNDKLLVATLFINTDINPNKFATQELKNLHLSITQNQYAFLKHDSFLDCSELKEVRYEFLADILSSNPTYIIGEISQEDWERIKETIKNAITITPKQKKKFGFV